MLIAIGVLIYVPIVYSLEAKKSVVLSVLLESGTSTRDIMPLLEKMAKFYGKYTERIYGQYRTGHILIFFNSKGGFRNVKELDDLGNHLAAMVIKEFPRDEGRVDIVPASSDFWDKYEVYFSRGKVTETNLSPGEKFIDARIALMNHAFSSTTIEQTVICDLEEGAVYGLKLGDIVNPKNVIDVIGVKPSSTAFWLEFSQIGLEVVLESLTEDSRITTFKVWYSSDDPLGEYSTKFTGVYKPALSVKETDLSIVDKFGMPLRVESNVFGNARYFYNRKYGEITFDFDRNNQLNMITMELEKL